MSESNTNNGKQRSKAAPRRLSLEKYFQACEWVKKNANDLRERRPTLAKLAEEMTRELGFPVSDKSAQVVTRHAGVSWQPKITRKPRQPKPAKTGAVLVIARAVENLYRQLAAPVPADLQALIEHLSESAPDAAGLPAAKGQTVAVGELAPAVARLGMNGSGSLFTH